MDSVMSPTEAGRRHRRLSIEVKESMRELAMQLSLLNHQVAARLDLKDIDLHCLAVIGRHGPLSPGALARRAGLHPATITGILDRLERGRWVARERDPADRRAVTIRVLKERNAELFTLYASMNAAMDGLCASYSEAELELFAGFLRRTAQAGEQATTELTGS